MRNAGYVPSAPSEMLGEAMVKNLESIKKYLSDGRQSVCVSGRYKKP